MVIDLIIKNKAIQNSKIIDKSPEFMYNTLEDCFLSKKTFF